jgi:hypothetical protein
MNNKQTATEWLFAHLLPFLPFSDAKEREHFRKCLEEAKAMEREQIVEIVEKSRATGLTAEYLILTLYGGEQ